jgi:competence protein ComEA
MFRSHAETSTARDRLRALTPGWVPTMSDLDEPEPAEVAPDAVDGGGSGGPEPARHALPEARGTSWRLDASGLRALASLALAAVAGGLVVVIVGWPRGDVAPPAAREGRGEAKVENVLLDPSASAAPSGEVIVDVDGRVRRPGVVELPAGSRVVDALAAAGGVTRGADTGALNLAQVLIDGEQVVVPGRDASAESSTGDVTSTAPPVGGSTAVSINSATESELETLPGIGPVLAAAIVEWRTQNGGFTSIEQLQEVSGIGPATYAELAPLVRL